MHLLPWIKGARTGGRTAAEKKRKAEDVDPPAADAIDALHLPKRRKIEKLKLSNKYEPYGAELFQNTSKKGLSTRKTQTGPAPLSKARAESSTMWTFSPPFQPAGMPELRSGIVPRWRESETFPGRWLCDLGNDMQRSYYQDGGQTQWVGGPRRVIDG